MISKDIAIVFDCGATNVRVIAIDICGKIIASKSTSNKTDTDPEYKEGIIWDLNKIWAKLCEASLEVISQINSERIAGVTVTTFGVDGTFVNDKGDMLYPIISWQCPRFQKIMDSIGKYIPLEKLYAESGVYPYAFNTINKLIWFKENRPEIPEKAYRFLFLPSLLLYKLTGEMRNDRTMVGTSMTMNLNEGKLSEEIFSSISINPSLFGDIAKSGDKAGNTTSNASKYCGIPLGTPAFFAGHDTQFAIFGSGAEINQTVLSSGTWEILMARSKHFKATKNELNKYLTTETDAQEGVFNIGQNWLGSGILEWFSRNFYPDLKGDELYSTMIRDAEKIGPCSHGLSIDPSFYKDSGMTKGGVIAGLTINTTRSQIYRAIIESLAFRLKESLEALEESGNFKAEKIICVGGGSQNKLWNQIRADVCNVPIELIDHKETTVLGAALFVFAGAGIFASEDEARDNISYGPQVILPSENAKIYEQQYQKYLSFKLMEEQK